MERGGCFAGLLVNYFQFACRLSSIFHSDIKGQNVILMKSNGHFTSEIKIIDFGGASNDFTIFYAHTSQFLDSSKFFLGFGSPARFRSKEERTRAELHCVAQTVLQLTGFPISSRFAETNLQQFALSSTFLDLFKEILDEEGVLSLDQIHQISKSLLSALQQNGFEEASPIFERISKYYQTYHISNIENWEPDQVNQNLEQCINQ